MSAPWYPSASNRGLRSELSLSVIPKNSRKTAEEGGSRNRSLRITSQESARLDFPDGLTEDSSVLYQPIRTLEDLNRRVQLAFALMRCPHEQL